MTFLIKFFSVTILLLSLNLSANLDEGNKDLNVELEGVNNDDATKAQELSDQNAKEPQIKNRSLNTNRKCKRIEGKLVCDTKNNKQIRRRADELETPTK